MALERAMMDTIYVSMTLFSFFFLVGGVGGSLHGSFTSNSPLRELARGAFLASWPVTNVPVGINKTLHKFRIKKSSYMSSNSVSDGGKKSTHCLKSSEIPNVLYYKHQKFHLDSCRSLKTSKKSLWWWPTRLTPKIAPSDCFARLLGGTRFIVRLIYLLLLHFFGTCHLMKFFAQKGRAAGVGWESAHGLLQG